jgi:hypothetical protein
VDEIGNDVKFTEKRGGGLNMRIEMNGMVIEGTVEELREIGVKFPVDEDETQKTELKVGDYAKVIEPGYCGDIEVGSIVKITNPKDDDGHYRVELLDGSDYDWFADDQLEKVAEEEIAQAKAKFEVGDYVVPLPVSDEEYAITNTDMYAAKVNEVHSENRIVIEIVAHKKEHEVGEEYTVNPKYFRKATDEEVENATEIVRWTKIGRKPGEFKKGDIVRLLEDSGAHEAGTLVEVHDNGNYKADDSVWGGEFDWYELVVPVEQRFDIAAEGVH